MTEPIEPIEEPESVEAPRPQPAAQHASSPIPWLIGGFALGLAIGLAGARPAMAVRGFFATPGWGWMATDVLVRGILRIP